MSHTPGPWRAWENIIQVSPNGDVVAEFIIAPNDADMRLMASAPDLLAALKQAEQAIHSEYCGTKCHAECVAVTDAIKKVEGA